MLKIILFLVCASVLLLTGLSFLILQPQFIRNPQARVTHNISQSPTITPTIFQPFTAKFKVITNGLTRDFSVSRYHNVSPDVYIASQSPQLVHVQKPQITWQDFFDTLPMKVTEDCLTTGTGQVFCNKANGTLNFYLNEIKTPKALEMRINKNDSLIIEYESQIQQSTQSATMSAQ